MSEETKTPATKKATKKAVKKATKKAAAVKKVAAAVGERGKRQSAYAGKKIYKLVKDPVGMRETGLFRVCWNVIKEGMKFDMYRELCEKESPGSYGMCRKIAADFIKKGFIEIK